MMFIPLECYYEAMSYPENLEKLRKRLINEARRETEGIVKTYKTEAQNNPQVKPILSYSCKETWSAKKKKTELTTLRGEAAKATILEMHHAICDVSVSISEAFSAVMKVMEEMGYELDDFEQVNRLLELYTEMSNHTRMPSNRGFTPKEMSQKMSGIPSSLTLAQEYGSLTNGKKSTGMS